MTLYNIIRMSPIVNKKQNKIEIKRHRTSHKFVAWHVLHIKPLFDIITLCKFIRFFLFLVFFILFLIDSQYFLKLLRNIYFLNKTFYLNQEMLNVKLNIFDKECLFIISFVLISTFLDELLKMKMINQS